ncbi:MAG: hypothetical protein QM669_09310 [Siphonobacter sp.]
MKLIFAVILFFFSISLFAQSTENLGIAMGKEIVTPQRATQNAGKKVTRRYTDVWINTKGTWHLIARQATNSTVE